MVFMQVPCPGQIGIWKCWILQREENQRTQRKTLGARREPTINSTHIWYWTGIKPWPHWWEANALTTAPSLLPENKKIALEDIHLGKQLVYV